MARKAGSADLPLHSGHVPKWLADRMTRLGTVISEAIVHHYGRDELLRRPAAEIEAGVQAMADDVWASCEKAQAFGRTVTVKVKFADFRQVTRSRSFSSFVARHDLLRQAGVELAYARSCPRPRAFGCLASLSPILMKGLRASPTSCLSLPARL